MNAYRRFVLKSLALSGLAGWSLGRPLGALAGTAVAPAAVARPVLALVNPGAAESAFLQGARAAGPRLRVQRVGRDLDFMLDLERQLRSRQAMRVIGLLDDASATLVVDLARSAGARVQWLGQHSAQAGFTRHRVLNTDMAAGCARHLARQLHRCGDGFSLSEERQGGTLAPRQLAGASRMGSRGGQWAASLGYLLASLGARTAIAAPLMPAANVPVAGSFVSFSIEV